MTAMPRLTKVIWAVYAWPGGRFLVTAWSGEPGSKEEHGPLMWEPSIEAARARVPAGAKRFEPLPEDVERTPTLVETWE
jgi:hypothetical protein